MTPKVSSDAKTSNEKDQTNLEHQQDSNLFSHLSSKTDEQEAVAVFDSPANNRLTSEFGGSQYDRSSKMLGSRESGFPTSFNELANSQRAPQQKGIKVSNSMGTFPSNRMSQMVTTKGSMKSNRMSTLAFGDGSQDFRAQAMLTAVAESNEEPANRMSDNAGDMAIESFLTGFEKQPASSGPNPQAQPPAPTKTQGEETTSTGGFS